LNWEQVGAILGGIGGLLGSGVGIGAWIRSGKANRLAEDANRISEASNKIALDAISIQSLEKQGVLKEKVIGRAVTSWGPNRLGGCGQPFTSLFADVQQYGLKTFDWDEIWTTVHMRVKSGQKPFKNFEETMLEKCRGYREWRRNLASDHL
jgi:hypothetical protein